MSSYFDALTQAMTMLARDPRTVFLGQAVEFEGTAMFRTFSGVPGKQRLELPVAEDMQMGMAIGMALDGMIPVCIYPRINFLLLAMNQLVLHLDKLPIYSGYHPRVIIRTAVATPKPLDPGPQHLGNFIGVIAAMCESIHVTTVRGPQAVRRAYDNAMLRKESSIIVEHASLY